MCVWMNECTLWDRHTLLQTYQWEFLKFTMLYLHAFEITIECKSTKVVIKEKPVNLQSFFVQYK